jgi:precorrin-6A/cobalt-precorrin-6A reductase
MVRVLLLGGTTEANQISRALAAAGIAGVYSYAGRTATPVPQPLPTRVGGFGGADGLADYIRQERITHVIDATHPFASQMSGHAVEACAKNVTPLIAFLREPWTESPGDKWQHVGSFENAASALPDQPVRVFLAIGRQHLAPFAAQPHHFYLLRLVDVLDTAMPLPNAEIVLARGPFTIEGDLALLRNHGITHVVTRNAGGEGAKAKLDAARALGLPVIMIDRPSLDLTNLPERKTAHSVEQIMRWLTHSACLGV